MKPLGICKNCGEFEGSCRCGKGKIILDGKRREQISKFLSGLLRHFPHSFGIKIDPEGWANIEDVERVLADRYGAGRREIELIVKFDPKGRFEIRNGKIRARYGHSINVNVNWSERGEIPPVLYHGTHPSNVDSILKLGLLPMKRKEVHLSSTIEEAMEVGRRYHPKPAVLAIDAIGLMKSGIEVRKKGKVYTTDYVPPKFIRRII
jgi:putative RNA 2'-phosphotransferase